jgi:hypothetical protein
MKKVFLSFSLFLSLGLTQLFAFAVSAPVNPVDPATVKETGIAALLTRDLSVEQFLALTPDAVEAQTGTKLSFKETLALKKAQKKIKNAMDNQPNGGPRKQLVAFLLCFFLGGLGIHRFYTGHTAIGVIQLLTGGGCGIWALIDLIRIATGDMKAKDGSTLEPW